MNQRLTPHRINLSACWHFGGQTGGRRTNLSDLKWNKEPRPQTLVRNFNRPTNLADDSRILLELTQWPPATECELNGTPLGICEKEICSFEVTGQLIRGQNEIAVHVAAGADVSDPGQLRVTLVLI